jgi:hypothetical protein
VIGSSSKNLGSPPGASPAPSKFLATLGYGHIGSHEDTIDHLKAQKVT